MSLPSLVLCAHARTFRKYIMIDASDISATCSQLSWLVTNLQPSVSSPNRLVSGTRTPE